MKRILFAILFALALASNARAVEDSLFIVKPESDSLAFAWARNTAFADDTVRLLNHSLDTISVTAAIIGSAFYLDSTHVSLSFNIAPDTAYQFFVRYNPSAAGTHTAWIAYSQPFDSTYLYGVSSDSLYIVKPGDSLQWGAKALGAASVTRTVRLLNHGLDTLAGTVFSSAPSFTLNGSTKDTLNYVIPDTSGVFEFTVSFSPLYRGGFFEWIYFSDPFDSINLVASATGGNTPKPLGPSLYGAYPFSGSGAPVNAYGQPVFDYTQGLYPVILYGGASMEDISEGCTRPVVSELALVIDTTNVTVHWHTDSACVYDLQVAGADTVASSSGATSATATISGLTPEYISTRIEGLICKDDDRSCCVRIDTTLATGCLAMGAPYLVTVAQSITKHVGLMQFYTWTPTSDSIRIKSDVDTARVGVALPSHSLHTLHRISLAGIDTPLTRYYVSIRGTNACGEIEGWSADASFYTDADTSISACATVAKSSIATQEIAATSATLHLHTNYICNVGYRYHLAGDNPWTYTYDTDADSLQHTKAITDLVEESDYVWQSRTIFSGCSASAWGDSTPFTTASGCPTVAKSSISTKGISTTNAKLQLTTDYDAHVGFRYHTGGGAWIYRHDADADSLVHTISIGSLDRGVPYAWESMTKYVDCDSSVYGDSTYFLSECPSIASIKGTPSTVLKTATSASMYFATVGYNTHGGFRYHATGNNPWIYRHDADADSVGHTVAIAGLTVNNAYVWESNAKSYYCDSVEYADSTRFVTPCPTVTPSNMAAKEKVFPSAKLFLNTDLAANVHYRYSKVSPESWIYRTDADADSTGHTISITDLEGGGSYKWQVRFKYATCDTTAYGNQQTFTAGLDE